MENPLHHFELTPLIPLHLFGLDISVNKAVLMMWMVCGVVFAFFYFAGRKAGLIPSKLQSIAEVAIESLKDLIRENAGEEGLRFFPFLATLFLFILFSNLLGLIPGAYTSTSQIIVTGAFAVMVYLSSLVVGFMYHGIGFLRVLIPSGVPMWLAPFMIPIELISQLSRPLSLAVRLFANMTAGHVVMSIFFGLVVMFKFYVGWIPLGFSVALYALEIFISFIQAYIFTLLAASYFGEAIRQH